MSGLEQFGYAVVPGALEVELLWRWHEGLLRAIDAGDVPAIRSRDGTLYAARQIASALPELADCLCAEPLRTLIPPGFGVVRSLFFDKPPRANWSVPWHRDCCVAVTDASARASGLPMTVKCGVPHVEADPGVLREMITVRVHLDPAGRDNGALRGEAGHARGRSGGRARDNRGERRG